MAGTSADKRALPIGKSFFDRVIEDGAYYVDKTLFVRDLIDRDSAVTLCTRPRRFGKTLNQTMLKCFFEDTAQIGGRDTRSLFRGLKIEEAGERYMEYQGKYPVIFLSFKETGKETFAGTGGAFKEIISEEFIRHNYVTGKIGDAASLKKFEKFSSGDGDISSYESSLKFLSKCLENYHGRRTVILIDEYDVPMQRAWACNYYKEMIDFIRPFLGGALKNNPHLQLAVMTGCLRISKESIFTGLNHLEVISVLNKYYSEYFGFTQDEMDAMLRYYGMEDKTQIVREWYNGYVFGDTEIYNPWSSLNVVQSWIVKRNEFPKPYWVNTSGNDIVRDMIDKMNAETRSGLETLMAGGTVSAIVRDGVTYNEIYKDADNLWNFLFFTGYLKKVGESVDSIGRIILEMKIPNKELHIIFEEKIKEWFNDSVKKKDLSVFFNAILSGDAETFQLELSKLLAGSISFMDSAENFYHGFMVGVLSGMEGYDVKSNRESGHGRSDLVLYSANGVDNKAVIFEFKIAKDFREMPEMCEEALKQIEENNYAAYWDKEGYDDIVKYGICFYKKRCKVLKD